MSIVQPPVVKSIMAIAAHPDDIESWCAGTLVLAHARGAKVRLLLVTSGEHGTSDSHVPAQQVALQREREARSAAEILGISEIAFLHYPDGDVEDTHTLRGQLVEYIRRWRPDVLFTHDPEHPYPAYTTHRDHRIVGRVALDAVYPLARDRLAFSEQIRAGLSQHIVREVWLFSSLNADSYIDISNGFERKVEARLAHISQTSDSSALRTGWHERFTVIGQQVGLSLAEAFVILKLE